MINDIITKYIIRARLQNLEDQQILDNLQASGWSGTDISDSFVAAFDSTRIKQEQTEMVKGTIPHKIKKMKRHRKLPILKIVLFVVLVPLVVIVLLCTIQPIRFAFHTMRCGKMPYVATSGFFGSRNFEVPGSALYFEHAITPIGLFFEARFYCSDNEAKKGGYTRSMFSRPPFPDESNRCDWEDGFLWCEKKGRCILMWDETC